MDKLKENWENNSLWFKSWRGFFSFFSKKGKICGWPSKSLVPLKKMLVLFWGNSCYYFLIKLHARIILKVNVENVFEFFLNFPLS